MSLRETVALISRRQALSLLVGLACLSCGPVLAGIPAAAGANPDLQVSVSATPSYGTAPLQVSFTASVASGTPTAYNWSFGDGSYYNGTNTSAASPTHTFAVPGAYTATVVVFEGTGSGSSAIKVHVVASPLSARVSVDALSGSAPLTVTLSSTVTGGTGTYVNFSWSLGDGGSGSGTSIRYTYLHPGMFHAFLTVFDSGNASTSASAWINVTPSAVQAPTLWTTVLALSPWVIGGLLAGVLIAWTVARLRTSGRGNVRESTATRTGSTPDPGPATEAVVREPSSDVGDPKAASPQAMGTKSPLRDEPLLVSQRVILHLSSQGRLGSEDVAPVTFTQGGMAAALNIPQNSLTNVLRRLVAAGILEEDTRHVRGRGRRLKVYHLTNRGELLAGDLRLRSPNR